MNTSIQMNSQYHRYREISETPITHSNKLYKMNLLAPNFRYLDWLILYTPLHVSVHPSLKPRNRILTIFISIFVWLLNMVDLAYFCYLAVSESQREKSGDIVNSIISGCNYIFWATSKSFAMYYFYFHFNYPWHSGTIKKFECNPMNPMQWNRFYVILIVIIFAMTMISDTAGTYLPYTSISTAEDYYRYIAPICFEYFWYYTPTCILFGVQCIVCIKYYGYMEQLIANTRREKDIMCILSKYKNICREFERDYHEWLRRSILSYLFAETVYIWIVMFSGLKMDKWWRICKYSWVISIFAAYIIPALALNAKFEQFQQALNEYGDILLRKGDGSLEMYNYLRIYMMESCVKIKIGKYDVTISNVIRVSLVFVLGKLAAYSVRHLY